MKTIAQIANEIGVSRQAVHKKVTGTLSSSLQGFTKKIDGVLHVNDEGQNIIKSSFFKSKSDGSVNSDVNKNLHVDVNLTPLVDSLNKQLEYLQQQLNSKDEQILSLQKLLENQQVLLKQEQDKNVLFLESSKGKKTIFQRLFRNKF